MPYYTEDPSHPGFALVTDDAIVPDPVNTGFGVVTVFYLVDTEPPIHRYTPGWLSGQSVYLADTRYGFTLGEVETVEYSQNQGTIAVTCSSRLNDMNDYNIQAEPFVGTLKNAFQYYASLGGATVDVSVDSSVENRPVVLPGWEGELWYHMKQLALAQECEISLVSGIILLRPIRARVAEKGYTVQRSTSVGGGPLAQAVEVYWYDTEEITNELVYPAGGWTPEVEVLNVNAGEDAEYTLEMSSSLSAIQAPVMEEFVESDYDASSVYTVVADDGLPVDPALWADHGGSVEVTLNPDTTTLTVRLHGATDIPLASQGFSRSFSLALASDESGSRYSTLRIVGTGVRYDRKKKTIRTGVTPTQTSTEVGVTIDNPFLNSLDAVYKAGIRAARAFSGRGVSLVGSVSEINRRGDSGSPATTYGQVKTQLIAELGAAPTYAQVRTHYLASFNTYGEIKQYWVAFEDSTFKRQAFGNVSGARVWDPSSRRWYRIRSGTITASGIDFSVADDDLTNEDIHATYSGMTYADVQTLKSSLTYQTDRLAGLLV